MTGINIPKHWESGKEHEAETVLTNQKSGGDHVITNLRIDALPHRNGIWAGRLSKRQAC